MIGVIGCTETVEEDTGVESSLRPEAIRAMQKYALRERGKPLRINWINPFRIKKNCLIWKPRMTNPCSGK
jgi:hypothetical protein